MVREYEFCVLLTPVNKNFGDICCFQQSTLSSLLTRLDSGVLRCVPLRFE